MKLAEIKVSELPDFIDGSLWQQLTPKPLTSLRAISQYQNPRAHPNDTALIIAYDDNVLVALVGLLPNFIHGQPNELVNSNTCWWVDAEKGKQLAIPLFLKALALCDQRMFMTNCTPHTLSILKKTNWFDFPETKPGTRGFLKFNSHEIIPAKFPATKKFKLLLKLADQTLNFLLIPRQRIIRSRFLKNVPKIEYLNTLNQELYQFIESHSQNEFIRRTGQELEWIVKFPWIKEKKFSKSLTPVDYPFSYIVDSFEQYFLKITESGQTIGLLFISIRDGHMKIPYVYFESENLRAILQVIYMQALLKNAVTLTTFNPELSDAMLKGKHPFIFRKKIKRLMAISKSLSEFHLKYPLIQDGDGDVVFT